LTYRGVAKTELTFKGVVKIELTYKQFDQNKFHLQVIDLMRVWSTLISPTGFLAYKNFLFLELICGNRLSTVYSAKIRFKTKLSVDQFIVSQIPVDQLPLNFRLAHLS
jgi:hypothetical protein